MEESLPIVSVIVPVYNVERYIRKCIDSILEQDHEDFEIIIVDDGSPDRSGEIADRYAESNEKIRVIHQKNKGVASARNRGMNEAKGEFILFVDPDDWISTDHISHLLKLQKISDADMCMTTHFYIRKTDKQVKKEEISTLSPEDAASLLLSPKMVVGTYNKLYRKKWLDRNKIYQNEALFSGEGLHFIVTAAQYANCVTISNRRIYFYRRNVAESATTKFNIEMFINNESSLKLIEKDKMINSKKFDSMLCLFAEHLKISGMLAILAYSSPKDHPEEYNRWKREVLLLSKRLLLDPYVPVRSKIRILGVIFFPGSWARLAKMKRKKIYKESV